MALPDDVPGRHRAVADGFLATARRVTDWEAPTPVTGWVARDVVIHLTTWFPEFLGAGSPAIVPGGGPSVGSDPAGAFAHQSEHVQHLLDDPATTAARFDHPLAGRMPLADAIDRFYTADVFMHTWDLGRSAGLDVTLDPDWASAMLAGMRQMEDRLRASGQFGEEVPVGDDAGPTERLMAFVGRDPAWQPGT